MSTHKVYGLIGYPLGHSFSRRFFTEKFAAEGIDAEYDNFELPSIDRVGSVWSVEGLAGCNVTIPYKERVIPFLDGLSDDAAAIGAVNVIRMEPSPQGVRRVGYNSDVVGFRESLRPLLGARHKRALVLGTGGASKAVCHGLATLGVEPVRVSREAGRGDLTYADLTPEVMAEHTVIVNTTPVGMYPHVDECPDIPYGLLTPAHLCYDLVYNPELTTFLRRAAGHGAATKSGIEMLHLQAIEAWRIWNM
ncbi:MAG: shikimate dehydrogenase [Duncaniella sp.]|nr:shikimate dehydrogenase [Duncaniella sp.]